MKITSFSSDVSFFWKWKLIFMFLYNKDCWLYLVFLKRPSCRLVQDWIRIPCIVFVIGSGSAARYLWPSGDKTIWTIYCTVHTVPTRSNAFGWRSDEKNQECNWPQLKMADMKWKLNWHIQYSVYPSWWHRGKVSLTHTEKWWHLEYHYTHNWRT